MKCKNCGAEIIEGAKFCGECGCTVEVPYKLCPHCGAKIPNEAVFCGECGERLSMPGNLGAGQEKQLQKNNASDIGAMTGNKNKKLIVVIVISIIIVFAVVAIILLQKEKPSDSSIVIPENTIDENDTYGLNEEWVNGSTSTDVSLKESGYTVLEEDGGYYISYGVIVENGSDIVADKALMVKITARDRDDSIIDTQEFPCTISIPSGESFGIGMHIGSFSEKPESVTIDLSYDPTMTFENNRTLLSTDGIKINRDGTGYCEIVGDVVNSTGKNLSAGGGFIIYRDQSDQIVGGETFHVEPINQGKNAFSITVSENAVLSERIDAYAVGYNR